MLLRSLVVAALTVMLCATTASAGVSGGCFPDYEKNLGAAMAQPDGTFQTVAGNCTARPGCNDYFDISLEAGATADVSLCTNGGTASFDTVLVVFPGPDFTSFDVCEDDTPVCGSSASAVSFVAPTTGIYRFRVGGFANDSGTYTLAYRAPVGSKIVPPRDAACADDFVADVGASVVTPGPAFTTLSESCAGTPGCGQYFDLVLDAGDVLDLSLCAAAGGSADFDAGLSIWSNDASPTQLACVDNTCGLMPELSFVAPSDGTYRVRIGGFGGESGAYDLRYRVTHAVCGDGLCETGEDDASCPADCGCSAIACVGAQAPAGCWCDTACEGFGDCCADACTCPALGIDCASCVPGDCNQTGSLDAGDPVCAVLCIVGTPPEGADCVCATDCNCSGSSDAGDPVCTVLRLIGAFSPDSCEP